MKGLKNNNYLIILLACACVLVLTKKATQYLDESLSRAPVFGGSFYSHGVTPKNLGNLYPVFAQELEANKKYGIMKDIDKYFVAPPQEAPVADPPPVVQKAPEPILPPPEPKPEPKPNYLKNMIFQFSLDGLSNHGAYINGQFYQIGDVVYQNRIDGQEFFIKVSHIKPDSIVLSDTHKNQQTIKFHQEW